MKEETIRANIIASIHSTHIFLFPPTSFLLFQKAHLTFRVIKRSNIIANPKRKNQFPNHITHNR